VRSFAVTKTPPQVDEPYNRTTVFSWRFPCSPNGNLTKFIVTCNRRDDANAASLSYEVGIDDDNEDYVLRTDDLVPGGSYTVSIKAHASGLDGKETYLSYDVAAGCEHQSRVNCAASY